MSPLFDGLQPQIVVPGRINEFRHVMHEGINGARLVIALKTRLSAAVLPEGMKFADKEVSAWGEHSRSFGKDKLKTLDVFQHEVARNQIDRRIIDGPGFGEIGDPEVDFRRGQTMPGALEHRFGEIDSLNPLSYLCEQRCVLSSPTADFKNCLVARTPESSPHNFLIQVAGEVAIVIVGVRPLVIGCENIHDLRLLQSRLVQSLSAWPRPARHRPC
jgi:hypothetical protein